MITHNDPTDSVGDNPDPQRLPDTLPLSTAFQQRETASRGHPSVTIPSDSRPGSHESIRLVERRNIVARERLLCRIRAEFAEMPGLSVTLGQATKLFGLTPEATSRILLGLVAERLLRMTVDRRYVRRFHE